MYWILKKEDDTPAICGSVIAVSEYTGISSDFLYYRFSKLKLLEIETPEWRICRLPVIKPAKTAKKTNGKE